MARQTPTMTIPDDIIGFLEQYRDAFNALEGAAVADLYALPSGIAQEGRYTHWSERRAIADNMTALCELYRQRSYRAARFEPIGFLDQGRAHAVVDVRWTIAWGDGAPDWTCHTAYNLIHTPQGWRVLLCTAYTEAALHRAT